MINPSEFPAKDRKDLEPVFRGLIQSFQNATEQDWNADAIKNTLTKIALENGKKYGQVVKPLRYSLTGTRVGIDIGMALELIGPVETLDRCQSLLKL